MLDFGLVRAIGLQAVAGGSRKAGSSQISACSIQRTEAVVSKREIVVRFRTFGRQEYRHPLRVRRRPEICLFLRLGEVSSIEAFEENSIKRVRTCLASGKQIITDKALSSMGRKGATSELNLRRRLYCWRFAPRDPDIRNTSSAGGTRRLRTCS
jgi:hypothetical protein